MTITFEVIKQYYNLCNPDESLKPTPEDARNVDIDSWQGIEKPRGINWVEELAGKIELSDKPECILFTGLPGSGKSTELRRLAARLQQKSSANLLPILVDADDLIDLTATIDIPDILSAVLLAAERRIREEEGKDPNVTPYESVFTRIANWFGRMDAELESSGSSPGKLSLPVGLNLSVALKTNPTLRQRVRQITAARLNSFFDEVNKALQLLVQRSIGLGYQSFVIIFDSLEKIRGTSTSWREVLDSVEKTFSAGAPYVRLSVHTLYTVPPALLSRRSVSVSFMPMIKLHHQDGSICQDGVDVVREMVRRRVPDAVLSEILGPHTEARVISLIKHSGGYPRELIRLLRAILAIGNQYLRQHTLPIPDSALARIYQQDVDNFRKMIPGETLSVLARVAQERFLRVVTDEDKERQMVDLLITDNVILRYLNQAEWYDLHPAVHKVPEVISAIQEYRPIHPAPV
jgi:energy-coupling factor transporter ATP-binding protein EcfA2